MQIEVLASGSTGNAYVVRGEREVLLLEAGLPIKELKQKLNYELPSICLISHEHKDHSKACMDLVKLGTTLYMSHGTAEELDLSGYYIKNVGHGTQVDLGEWVVLFFDTEHDCKNPIGWLLVHKATGKKILFATDTFYLKYQFEGVTHAMVECNYASDILEANEVNQSLRNRIVQSHFELENVKEFFRVLDKSKLEHVTLLHLSDKNSDEERFKKEVQEIVNVQVDIAKPGLIIKL